MSMPYSLQRRLSLCLVLTVVLSIGCSSETDKGDDPNADSDKEASKDQEFEKQSKDEVEGLGLTISAETQSQVTEFVKGRLREFLRTQLTAHNGAYKN